MYYLDNAATTEIDPRVFSEMKPYLTEAYGNAGSMHQLGRAAAKAVDEAREEVSALIGARPEQIIFTSGGSEANNLAFLGMRGSIEASTNGRRIVVTAIEHESVRNAAQALERLLPESKVYRIAAQRDGRVPLGSVAQFLDRSFAIVSVMCVNNETGAINPVEDIATMCMKHGVPFHTDCVQALGVVPIDVQTIGCDMLSISAHKIHGPKGVGALFVKDPACLEPLICGSPYQEFGLRGGTENVAGIVGFGEACRLLRENFKTYECVTAEVKQEFYARLNRRLGDSFTVNGPSVTAPGKILSLTFPGVDAQTLLLMLDAKGVCVSTGSACSAHSMKPSAVLKAMGLTDAEANSTIRVSFSRLNKLDEVSEAAEIVAECVEILREAEGRSCEASKSTIGS